MSFRDLQEKTEQLVIYKLNKCRIFASLSILNLSTVFSRCFGWKSTKMSEFQEGMDAHFSLPIL